MEKLISFDSGPDMLALQAFMVLAEMPSIPQAFFTLDFSMKVSRLSGVIGLKSKGCAFSNFELIVLSINSIITVGIADHARKFNFTISHLFYFSPKSSIILLT